MDGNQPLNVLFTSAGRRVELLRAFRAAYAALNLPGVIVAVDIDPLAPALQASDRHYLVPRLGHPDYLDAIVEVCRREQIGLVLPLIDDDIPFLARHREALERTGARLGVVTLPAAEITADKWLTTRFFQSLGLATPRSWLPGEFDPARAAYPVFIKPRNGSASKNAFRIDNQKEAVFFLDYVPDPIIQECLPGPEITSDVICDLAGAVLGVVSRQRLAVRAGEIAKGVTVHDQRVLAACVRIAQALPAVGPITVQCLMRDGVPHFIEINARFGGGSPLGFAAGVDAPRLLLASAAGRAVEPPPLGEYRTGLYMTRFDDTFFLTESERERVAGHRL